MSFAYCHKIVVKALDGNNWELSLYFNENEKKKKLHVTRSKTEEDRVTSDTFFSKFNANVSIL